METNSKLTRYLNENCSNKKLFKSENAKNVVD